MDKQLGLGQLGLTKTESDVYLALLGLGSTTSGPLVKRTELHRATVYDVLKRLMQKGLVNYIIKGKTKHFEATDPSHLLDIIEEEKKAVQKKKQSTSKLVKELKQIQKSAEFRQQAHVFVGVRGIKNIYELVLKSREVFIFGSHGRAKKMLGGFFDYFKKNLKKNKVKARLIISQRMRNSFLDTPQFYDQIKFMSDEFDSPNTTFVFGNYVATIVWTENPVGFLIESKEAADSFRNYFEIIWRTAKP